MAAMNINSKKLKEMIENGKTFLVDFWAPWCPHCRKINPAYEQIAEQYAGVLEVVKSIWTRMTSSGVNCKSN